jgi:predicted MFS family arabinose efflux permease
LDYRLVYLLLLVPLAALIVAFVAARLPPSAGVYGEAPSEAIAGGMAREGRWDLHRSAPLLLVAAIAVFGLLAEGAIGTLVGHYLRDWLGAGALLGGSGVAAFYGAMALGRLAPGWTVGRLGNRHSLFGAGLLVTFGMALALATTAPSLVIVGFLIVGMALAGHSVSSLLCSRGPRAAEGGVCDLGCDCLRLRGVPAGSSAGGRLSRGGGTECGPRAHSRRGAVRLRPGLEA